MNQRFKVYLNGIALESVTDVCVVDVQHDDPGLEYSVAGFAARSGGAVTGLRKPQAGVTITFELHEYSVAARNAACQAIAAWARDGGVLEINERPLQYLQCVCTKLPYIDSALKWTSLLSVGFTAYGVPYWQGKVPQSVTLTGAEASGTLFVPGNARQARVDVEVTPSTTITSLSVTVGSTTIALSGISTSSVITISHHADGYITIKAGATSILDKRTAASSDDLLGEAGATNTVSVTASASVTAVFSAKGAWH